MFQNASMRTDFILKRENASFAMSIAFHNFRGIAAMREQL